MSDRMRGWIRVACVMTLSVALVGLVSGCCTPDLPLPAGSTGETTTSVDATASTVATSGGTAGGAVTPAQTGAAAGAAAGGGSTTGQTVVVPEVRGRYYDDAAAIINAAGLQAVDISIHGPIDSDAGEPGIIYRQTPATGASVPAGTKVELRSWWESQ